MIPATTTLRAAPPSAVQNHQRRAIGTRAGAGTDADVGVAMSPDGAAFGTAIGGATTSIGGAFVVGTGVGAGASAGAGKGAAAAAGGGSGTPAGVAALTDGDHTNVKSAATTTINGRVMAYTIAQNSGGGYGAIYCFASAP
jgi:hypothetical protein